MVVKSVSNVDVTAPKQSTRKKSATKKAENGFMLNAIKAAPSPPWLLEQDVPAKPVTRKTKIVKSRAKAKPKGKPKKPAAIRGTTKSAAKAAVENAAQTIHISHIDSIQEPVIQPTNTPLTRSQAPIVWRKNGAMGAIGYWLRSTGRSMLAAFGPAGNKPLRTQAPIGAKLRTKNDLLREIAILRQENAMMREKLGLPPMPFGRLQADKI
jgi:hypothetical protein